MFVVVWLIALYVYEIVCAAFHGTAGIAAAVLTVVINLYARKRAVACVEPNLAFKLWNYLPALLIFVVPLAVKIITYFTDTEGLSWWEHVYSLTPLFLKLGVPLVALLWAYVVIGKLQPSIGKLQPGQDQQIDPPA